MYRKTWLPALLTAIVYLATGWASLWLAVPPGYASPVFPPTGIALACVLTYGWRVLPGVWLGSFLLNLSTTLNQDTMGLHAGVLMGLPLIISAGGTLQAAAGAFLVRRFVSQPLTLSEPRDVARFFGLGAIVACMVSATVATLALHRAGAIAAGGDSANWWIWWAGDTLGVLIAAPITLTLIGRPAGDWVHRRLPVGLSLVLVTALLATAAAQVARWDEQRTRVIFERDATRSADALVAQLNYPLHALEAVRGTAAAMGELTAEALRETSAHWLAQPFNLKAIGWADRVPRNDLAAYQARIRAQPGMAGFRVFDRTDPEAAAEALQDPDVMAIRAIEPRQGNAAALGVNPLSIGPARPAVLISRATGMPTASGGFRLTQETGDQTGVVIYQVLYEHQPRNETERQQLARGMAFVTLRMEEAVRSVAATLPGYLQWCLVDTRPQGGRHRLAGAQGCDQQRPIGFVHVRPIDYAGRQWELRLTAAVDAVPDSRHWNAWLFSLVGLMATAMLGALLLSVTGRTRRIEVAVAERTADLQREVAERARTEAALRESEQRFRSMFDQVPIGVIYTDLQGRILQANPKLRDMVGYNLDELTRMNVADLTHSEDRAADIELNRRLVSGQLSSFRRQKRLVSKERRVIQVQAGVSLLHDEQGRPDRLVSVLEDITEHLKLQEAERARESAEAANRAKSDFVSRMSHELRTPLNAMLGFAQLLELDRQQPLLPRQIEWTSQIQQAGWHLLHMINDTLDLSRIESGSLKLDMAAVPLAHAVEATRALVEQAARHKGVAIEVDLDSRASTVFGDPTRVKQVLTNLLSNAVKYNVEHGSVRIRSRLADPQTVELEVSDTGLGLSAAQLAELFQPFNRLGREAHGEGTGIGLVISRRLAELMGGTLTADGKPGGGACFRLRLPRAQPGREAAASPADDERRMPHYRQRLVHYIEDNETNAEVMRGIMAQRPQIRLQVSTTGLDGLAAIRMDPPSLVLLDMHLPDIDGLELLRHLKLDPATASTPVVVVSADATGGRIDQAMALGAAHYITKPVNVADMLGLLDELLEQQDTRFGAEL